MKNFKHLHTTIGKTLSWSIPALFVWFAIYSCQTPTEHSNLLQTDVCILGGSEAAFTAAIQSARMGRDVALIEPTGHPGGMMVEGIAKDIRFGSSVVIGGIAREVYTAVEARYGRQPNFDSAQWYSRYEPRVAEAVIEELLAGEKNIQIIRKTRIREQNGVKKNGATIQNITLEDGREIAARVFIDASVEGDLLHYAGVTTETIREGNAKYGETKNGIQTENTYRQFEVQVDPYVVPGEPASGLIPTIQSGELGEYGAPSKYIQGFCFRLVLTRDSANRLPIDQPANYDPQTYEIYRRYLQAGGRLFRRSGQLARPLGQPLRRKLGLPGGRLRHERQRRAIPPRFHPGPDLVSAERSGRRRAHPLGVGGLGPVPG